MKRLQLNRLWVQFSVVLASVVLLGAGVLILTAFLMRPERPERPEQERPDPPPELRAQVREAIATTLIVLAVTGGAVGVLGGVWMARRLTAPLDELARGVDAIGAQDLSYRVAEKGSYETVTLARSFNHMTAQLEEAEQLRQNLLADVAHELRTPLTVLQGNLRALLDDVYALDKSEVARLYDQTRHLSGLVNDLHELAQAEARRLPLAVERVDLSDVVRSATELVAPIAADREIRLEVDVPDAPVFAMADRARTMQILQNLLANALRHTHAGGAIGVTVAGRMGTVDLSVRDTGDGIDAAQLPHIFNRFYRTDGARARDAGGAGLGLAIVRALAEAQGGSVQASSAGIGQGATFRVTLPRG